METKSTFWWLKSTSKDTQLQQPQPPPITVPKLELDLSTSLVEFLEKEQSLLNNSNRTDNDDNADVDVGSIIEEISRVAAESPLGPYELSNEQRSIDEIMKEAERIYLESSKNFEQLSQRSRTSQNITDINSKNSTPTPKSISPLPTDDDDNNNNNNNKNNYKESSESEDSYSDDFSVESRIQSVHSPNQQHNSLAIEVINDKRTDQIIKEIDDNPRKDTIEDGVDAQKVQFSQEIAALEQENKQLREEIHSLKIELQQTLQQIEQITTKTNLINQSTICSPEINQELERTLEELKDTKEINTVLQLQLDTINNTYIELKNSNEDLLSSNKGLERRIYELEITLEKYKNELVNLQNQRDKFVENETNLNKLLEIERLQNKSLKLQNDKDTKSIQDLNRQIKEMERIIARKHPDSVSALIVAAKHDDNDNNLNKNTTTRKLLEDRIRILEEEASIRNQQSTKIFLDIQEKFNQMKSKYENHIDDLELHVNDLKQQLKTKRIDTFDVYTQTEQQQKLEKETTTISVQTDPKIFKTNEIKQDTHLIQTIRGLQNDLTNKEKLVMRQQREIDELKKTRRKLQKERENSLKNLNERREFRSYPEKLSQQSSINRDDCDDVDDVDKVKQQLCRIEEDYQALKNRRLHDLNVLQEAHEREIADYMKTTQQLREQLELQRIQLIKFENQLKSTKDELLLIQVERDHLNQQLKQLIEQKSKCMIRNNYEIDEIESLQKKIEFLEKRYEERETRLRSIIHNLVYKTNQSCEQCSERQQQLISYKIELDQLLATLRALKSSSTTS